MWVYTARNGLNRVWGSLPLVSRGALAAGQARTGPIQHDASATEMEAALEELQTDDVASRGMLTQTRVSSDHYIHQSPAIHALWLDTRPHEQSGAAHCRSDTSALAQL